MLLFFKTLPDRMRQLVDIQLRPPAPTISALAGRFGAIDTPQTKAVVLGDGMALARQLGLKQAQILHLPYPDFTLEELALLGDEYDVVISDRMLHLTERLDDAASETIRVLKPGGLFVHTTGALDFSIHGNADTRRLSGGRLGSLFPHSTVETGRQGTLRWIMGRKNDGAPPIEATVLARRGRRRWYRFQPQHARFGLVAIVKNEAPYLLEWIAYHRLLGFEQITLYDNFSTDASARILAPLAHAGIINAVQWRDRKKKQRKAYNNARRRLSPFIEWCLFADLDEFLVLDPGRTLDDLVAHPTNVAGVGIPWRVFRSGGRRSRGTDLTIEGFLMADARNNVHVKSIVRLKSVRSMHLHVPKRYDGRLLEVGGSEISSDLLGRLPRPASGIACINHYFTRSWEEYTCKLARGRAGEGSRRSIDSFDRTGPGDIELRNALPLAPAVREEVARLRAIVGTF